MAGFPRGAKLGTSLTSEAVIPPCKAHMGAPFRHSQGAMLPTLRAAILLIETLFFIVPSLPQSRGFRNVLSTPARLHSSIYLSCFNTELQVADATPDRPNVSRGGVLDGGACAPSRSLPNVHNAPYIRLS